MSGIGREEAVYSTASKGQGSGVMDMPDSCPSLIDRSVETDLPDSLLSRALGGSGETEFSDRSGLTLLPFVSRALLCPCAQERSIASTMADQDGSFLEVASKERASNKVVKTWVRQLRDLALDVEDCLELVVHLDNSSPFDDAHYFIAMALLATVVARSLAFDARDLLAMASASATQPSQDCGLPPDTNARIKPAH
ncbi:hypothetical protein HU200_041186 [Digitaria exilis]|uniref:Disease resistance N-terminal domain-containing protein n=1 Tax=Digitaria exilis TaxID=1010633 RepID=A0A835B5H7_9POAL|nr:hypothetical protein HU200_041186 [Digitaria exilis]